MHLAPYALLIFLSFGVAAHAVVVYALLPLGAQLHPDMRAVFNAYPLGIYAHVFAAALTLVIAWRCWVPNLIVAEWLIRRA
jgi:hypothetical protein